MDKDKFLITVTYESLDKTYSINYDESKDIPLTLGGIIQRRIKILNLINKCVQEDELITEKIGRVKNITLAFWEGDQEWATRAAKAFISKDKRIMVPRICNNFQIEEKNDKKPTRIARFISKIFTKRFQEKNDEGSGIGSAKSLPESEKHNKKSSKTVRFTSNIFPKSLQEETKTPKKEPTTCFCWKFKLGRNRVHPPMSNENGMEEHAPEKLTGNWVRR